MVAPSELSLLLRCLACRWALFERHLLLLLSLRLGMSLRVDHLGTRLLEILAGLWRQATGEERRWKVGLGAGQIGAC